MSNRGLRANTTGTSNVGGDITGTAGSDGKFGLDVNVIAQAGGGSAPSVDDNNSTTTPLTNGSTFTGTWTERTTSEMIMAPYADQDFTFYADFSPDGTNVDSTLSYTYTAGQPYVPRRLVIARKYYRVRVVNDSGSNMTELRFQTSIGDFAPLASRLNASLSLDADAEVQRAIITGINPDGDSYSNVPIAGYMTAFSSDTPLTNGATFDSGINDLSSYQFLQTEIYADVDGTLVGTWYDDSLGTNTIRTFTLPYTADEGLSLTATPVLAQYLKYVFTNSSGDDQTVFRIRVKLSNVPYSGQVLKVEQFVPTNVLTTLNRSVLVAKDPDNIYQNIRSNDAGALAVSDFLFGVARGDYADEGFRSDSKFGINPEIDTTTDPEDVWEGGGNYTGQPAHSAAAETVTVVSSSTADTSAGTGARTVKLYGLNGNFVEQEETVTLNGTTPVTTTLSWTRVYRVVVLTAGSGGENAGTITVAHSTTTANVFAVMQVGYNQSAIAALTVPARTDCYILGYRSAMSRASGAAGSARVSLRVRPEGGVYNTKRMDLVTSSYPVEKTYRTGLYVPPKADIKVRCDEVSDNDTLLKAELEYVLVENLPANAVANTYSIDFDGTNDKIDCGTATDLKFDGTEPFTISIWHKFRTLGSGDRFISNKLTTGYEFFLGSPGGPQMFIDDGPNLLNCFANAFTYVVGQWYHTVVTYSGSQAASGISFYIDGVGQSTSSSGTITNSAAGDGNFTIGSTPNNAAFFDGNMDEVSVWDKVLSSTEVEELYNEGVPTNLFQHSAQANLVSWWRMGDGDTYPTIEDQKGTNDGTMTNMAANDLEEDTPA